MIASTTALFNEPSNIVDVDDDDDDDDDGDDDDERLVFNQIKKVQTFSLQFFTMQPDSARAFDN